MHDVVVSTCGTLLRWHHEKVSVTSDANGLPVLGLGAEVTCGTGRTTLKSGRKMSPPKDFKRSNGLVAAIHVEADEDDLPYFVEIGVQTGRGFGWFSPGEVALVVDGKRVLHAC